MEIHHKNLRIGAIYRYEWDRGKNKVIFRFNGFGESSCLSTSRIDCRGNFDYSTCASLDGGKFYTASIEEMQWLEACEKAGTTVSKPTNIEHQLLIFN